MTRRTIEETRRFHLFLYKSDLDYLERRFGSSAGRAHRLGLGVACREIIHERVKRLRARENERLDNIIAQQEEEEYEDAD